MSHGHRASVGDRGRGRGRKTLKEDNLYWWNITRKGRGHKTQKEGKLKLFQWYSGTHAVVKIG